MQLDSTRKGSKIFEDVGVSANVGGGGLPCGGGFMFVFWGISEVPLFWTISFSYNWEGSFVCAAGTEADGDLGDASLASPASSRTSRFFGRCNSASLWSD